MCVTTAQGKAILGIALVFNCWHRTITCILRIGIMLHEFYSTCSIKGNTENGVIKPDLESRDNLYIVIVLWGRRTISSSKEKHYFWLMFKHLKLLMQPVFQQTIGAKHIIATANSSCDDNAEKIEIERCLLHLKKNRTFISQLHTIHT